jgi:hypothetical protein
MTRTDVTGNAGSQANPRTPQGSGPRGQFRDLDAPQESLLRVGWGNWGEMKRHASSGAAGNSILNVEPFPTSLSTVSVPP